MRGLDLGSVGRAAAPGVAGRAAAAGQGDSEGRPRSIGTPSNSLAAGLTISTRPVGIERDDALFEAIQDRRQPATLALDHRERNGETLPHLIDAHREPADLVGEAIVHRMVEVAARDRARRRGEASHASRDEGRDGEADDDGQRHCEQRAEDEAATQRIARARRESGARRVGDERDRRACLRARGQRHDV